MVYGRVRNKNQIGGLKLVGFYPTARVIIQKWINQDPTTVTINKLVSCYPKETDDRSHFIGIVVTGFGEETVGRRTPRRNQTPALAAVSWSMLGTLFIL